ncbi:MAG: hypothetical protein ABI647_25350 [Gemmatimonadota bacterium]
MPRIVVLVFTVLAAACTTAYVVAVDSSPRTQSAAESVEVLLDPPTRPYRTLALIEIGGEASPSAKQLMARARIEAAKLGGQAVIISPGTKRDVAFSARVIEYLDHTSADAGQATEH